MPTNEIKPGTGFSFSYPAEEARYLRSESWRLAWPVFLGQGGNQIMILLSRMMVGHLGEGSLAGVGIGQMIFFALVVGLSAVGIGVVALVARQIGAEDKEEAGRILGQGVMFGILLSLGLSALGIALSRPLFQLLQSPPEVINEGVKFIRIVFLGLAPASIAFFLSAGLRGAGDTRTPMIIVTVCNMINLILQYLLIFGKAGFPRLGIVGAGVAMVVGFCLAILAFFVLFASGRSIIPIYFSGFKLNRKIIWQIIRIGGPTAIEWELIQLGLIAFISIINHFGTEPSASYIIGVTILPFAQIPAMAYRTSVTTMVGIFLGAKRADLAEKSIKVNVRYCLIWMGILAVVLFSSARFIISYLFPTSSFYTKGLAELYIKVIAICLPLVAVSFINAGGLRGAGATKIPMVIQGVGMYVFRIGIALILWQVAHLQVHWLWLSLIPDFLFRTIFLSLAVKKGKWKLVKV